MFDFGSAPYADIWNFADVTRAPTDPFASASPAIQALIDKGVITRTDRTFQNESGEGRYTYDTVNWGDPSLPRMGPSNSGSFNWIPVAGRKLIDSNMVYNDPNYGPLTPVFNEKNERSWLDLIGPLAMGAITLGAGAIASGAMLGGASLGGGLATAGATTGALTSVPWYVSSGLSVARQVGSGNVNPVGIGTALLPGASEFGIPNELITGTKLALGASQAMQSRNSTPPASDYNPSLFGDLNSMAQVNNNDSQRVATSIAPDAYNNSYNQVVT